MAGKIGLHVNAGPRDLPFTIYDLPPLTRAQKRAAKNENRKWLSASPPSSICDLPLPAETEIWTVAATFEGKEAILAYAPANPLANVGTSASFKKLQEISIIMPS